MACLHKVNQHFMFRYMFLSFVKDDALLNVVLINLCHNHFHWVSWQPYEHAIFSGPEFDFSVSLRSTDS